MARISKHGQELARIERLKSTRAYYSDGTILQNTGNGWTVYGHVKPGIDVKEHADRKVKEFAEWLAERPAYAAFLRKAKEIAPISKRWKLVATLDAIPPTDPDGIWSTLDDDLGRDKVCADFDDIKELCDLLLKAETEHAQQKAAQSAGEGI